MKVEDVTDTLNLALRASGCDLVHVVYKPRLLSDNGSSYVSGNLAVWLGDKGMKHSRGALSSPDTRQNRLSALQATPAGQRRLAPDVKEPHLAGTITTTSDITRV